MGMDKILADEINILVKDMVRSEVLALNQQLNNFNDNQID